MKAMKPKSKFSPPALDVLGPGGGSLQLGLHGLHLPRHRLVLVLGLGQRVLGLLQLLLQPVNALNLVQVSSC